MRHDCGIGKPRSLQSAVRTRFSALLVLVVASFRPPERPWVIVRTFGPCSRFLSAKTRPVSAHPPTPRWRLCRTARRPFFHRLLGPRVAGKLHIYVGDMDNYYLNNAVKLTEDFLETTSDPPYGGEVDYGDGDEHCWNGDHTRGNGLSRLRYIQMFAPRIVERIRESAPRGADYVERSGRGAR